MHAAFRQGGREMMRTQPAVFLKLLVLLVPRQMTLDHSGGVKDMTDEQLERGIELIKEMLAKREAGANAKVIEGEAPLQSGVRQCPSSLSGDTSNPDEAASATSEQFGSSVRFRERGREGATTTAVA